MFDEDAVASGTIGVGRIFVFVTAQYEYIILADEPTGALDTETAGGVMSLFEELNSAGKTIVIVIHTPI